MCILCKSLCQGVLFNNKLDQKIGARGVGLKINPLSFTVAYQLTTAFM